LERLETTKYEFIKLTSILYFSNSAASAWDHVYKNALEAAYGASIGLAVRAANDPMFNINPLPPFPVVVLSIFPSLRTSLVILSCARVLISTMLSISESEHSQKLIGMECDTPTLLIRTLMGEPREAREESVEERES